MIRNLYIQCIESPMKCGKKIKKKTKIDQSFLVLALLQE